MAGAIRHTDTPMRFPVAGGTGAYARVSGELVQLGEDSDRKVSIFRLVLFR